MVAVCHQNTIYSRSLLVMCLSLLIFKSPLPLSPQSPLDDFKPQSVDSTKSGHLKVSDEEVNVSLPVVGQVCFLSTYKMEIRFQRCGKIPRHMVSGLVVIKGKCCIV